MAARGRSIQNPIKYNIHLTSVVFLEESIFVVYCLFYCIIKSMGSSKQLLDELKKTIVSFYKGGEGCKELSSRFKLSTSTIRNVIKKWKSYGTVEVQKRSGRPRKIMAKIAKKLVRTAMQNPQATAGDLQESN